MGLFAGERFDRPVFGDTIAKDTEMQYDCLKGGVLWKENVSTYFIGKCPALIEVLKWVEGHNLTKVTNRMFEAVTSHYMRPAQQAAVTTQIWSFLARCLSGAALTMFKEADKTCGLDAWRRVVRVIDSGCLHHLEDLREVCRTIHLKPIKDVEGLLTGIVEYETKLREYKDAGGICYSSSDEMKSDLERILPQRLREELLWHSTDPNMDYNAFRLHVTPQAAEILRNRRRGDGVHAVDEPRPAAEPRAAEEDESSQDDIVDSLRPRWQLPRVLQPLQWEATGWRPRRRRSLEAGGSTP